MLYNVEKSREFRKSSIGCSMPNPVAGNPRVKVEMVESKSQIDKSPNAGHFQIQYRNFEIPVSINTLRDNIKHSSA